MLLALLSVCNNNLIRPQNWLCFDVRSFFLLFMLSSSLLFFIEFEHFLKRRIPKMCFFDNMIYAGGALSKTFACFYF